MHLLVVVSYLQYHKIVGNISKEDKLFPVQRFIFSWTCIRHIRYCDAKNFFLKSIHCSQCQNVSWSQSTTDCVTAGKHTELLHIPFFPSFSWVFLNWQKTVNAILVKSHLDSESVPLALCHLAWSLMTPEHCTWTRINLDSVCQLDGLGGLENMLGWILNLMCWFWNPAIVHFLRHRHTYPAVLPEHLVTDCTILQCGSHLDKDKLVLKDFWHQLPFTNDLWNLESSGSLHKNPVKHSWSR